MSATFTTLPVDIMNPSQRDALDDILTDVDDILTDIFNDFGSNNKNQNPITYYSPDDDNGQLNVHNNNNALYYDDIPLSPRSASPSPSELSLSTSSFPRIIFNKCDSRLDNHTSPILSSTERDNEGLVQPNEKFPRTLKSSFWPRSTIAGNKSRTHKNSGPLSPPAHQKQSMFKRWKSKLTAKHCYWCLAGTLLVVCIFTSVVLLAVLI